MIKNELDSLVKAGECQFRTEEYPDGKTAFLYEVTPGLPTVTLPAAAFQIILRVLGTHGNLSAKEIGHLSYQTAPILDLQQSNSQRFVRLNFHTIGTVHADVIYQPEEEQSLLARQLLAKRKRRCPNEERRRDLIIRDIVTTQAIEGIKMSYDRVATLYDQSIVQDDAGVYG